MLTDTLVEIQSYVVQVEADGEIVLPEPLLDAFDVKDSGFLTLIRIGDVILLSPKEIKGPLLAEKFAALMQEHGVTLADLLADLPQIREEVYRELYETGSSV